MDAETIITPEVRARIEAAIHEAESGTACELRVHVEDECETDPLDRASFIFAELDMHKTVQRNGVLIYLALSDKKMAIIGDVGINKFLEPGYWDSTRDLMLDQFRKGNIETGIIQAVLRVGEKMKIHFPFQTGDINELSNQVTTGKIGKR